MTFILDADGVTIFGKYRDSDHWTVLTTLDELDACEPPPNPHPWRKPRDIPLTRDEVRAILAARSL
jgi:hypothetical protein